jgi:hypothetical protein
MLNAHTECLKVPKCEIFDRSDFHDFYTISSLLYGRATLGFKKNIFYKYLGAHLGRMLSLLLKIAVLSKRAEHTHQELMGTLNIRVRN